MSRPKRRRVGVNVDDKDEHENLCLLQFTEDSQLQVTPEHLVRNTASGKTIGLWFPDNRWYEAEVLERGGKKEMEARKIKVAEKLLQVPMLNQINAKLLNNDEQESEDQIKNNLQEVNQKELEDMVFNCTLFEGKKEMEARKIKVAEKLLQVPMLNQINAKLLNNDEQESEDQIKNNLQEVNQKELEDMVFNCTLFEGKKEMEARKIKVAEKLLQVPMLNQINAKLLNNDEQESEDQIKNNLQEVNQKELEDMVFNCTLFEDKKSVAARKDENQAVLTYSTVSNERKSLEASLGQTGNHKIRKATENVSYKDSYDLDVFDFSPDVSEYEPEEDSETSDDDSHNNETEPTDKKIKSVRMNIPNINETETENLNTVHDTMKTQPSTLIDHSTNAITDSTNVMSKTIKIDLTKKKPDGKRKWDKKYMCKYCRNSYPKLPRHLEDKHQEEIEVAQFLSMPVGSETRKKLIEKIRLQGEKMFNFSLYGDKNSTGKIITKRRPTVEEDAKNFLPCEFCGSFLKKTYLARHVRVCTQRRGNSDPNDNPDGLQKRMTGVQSRAALLLPSAPDVPRQFKENILEKMAYDEVYNEIIGDNLILAFGTKIFETKKKKPSQFREVKDRMRELGRLLIAAKQISDKVTCLIDLINPTMYNVILEATKNVAGYDSSTGNYETPSLAIKVGQSLRKCASKYKGMCMDDEVMQQNLRKIELFESRMKENWTDDAVKDAHTTLHERKWNAPKRLPLTEDVKKMNKYLTDTENEILECHSGSGSESLTTISFRKLCENTLCRVILLNRRRVGEAQYMRLSDYQKASTNPPREDSEDMNSLSDVERVLVKTLTRVEIRGKRGRMVPVILTPSIQKAISLLTDNRNRVGIPENNDYLFPAAHSSTGHYRADVLLRNAAFNCGAKNPISLTGTQLRKHVATMIQLLNLRENELDAVANYLGHDIRIHRQFYRLPHETMQLAKISKLLINMESGNINTMRGQNLDDINVCDEIDDEENFIPDDEENGIDNDLSVEPAASISISRKPNSKISTKTTISQKRKKFSKEHSTKIKEYFRIYIQEHRVPCQKDVNQFLDVNPEMKEIEWSRIKFHVYNCFASKKNKN